MLIPIPEISSLYIQLIYKKEILIKCNLLAYH